MASVTTKRSDWGDMEFSMYVFSKFQSEIHVNIVPLPRGGAQLLCLWWFVYLWCPGQSLCCILRIDFNLYIILSTDIKLLTRQNYSIFHCLKSGLKDQILCFDFAPFYSETLLQYKKQYLVDISIRNEIKCISLTCSRSNLASRQIFLLGKINKY